jgi:hypothetical protein
LWALDAREYQYVACDLLARHQRVCGAHFLVRQAEPLIQTKSWWDTVDALRSAVVGPLVSRHDELVDVMWRWIDSDDIWLVRSAIIHQLGYGEHTDEDRLFALCARRADHPDFFVRKAIGWALREMPSTPQTRCEHSSLPTRIGSRRSAFVRRCCTSDRAERTKYEGGRWVNGWSSSEVMRVGWPPSPTCNGCGPTEIVVWRRVTTRATRPVASRMSWAATSRV